MKNVQWHLSVSIYSACGRPITFRWMNSIKQKNLHFTEHWNSIQYALDLATVVESGMEKSSSYARTIARLHGNNEKAFGTSEFNGAYSSTSKHFKKKSTKLHKNYDIFKQNSHFVFIRRVLSKCGYSKCWLNMIQKKLWVYYPLQMIGNK